MTRITKVLIANRGEIAVRILRACRDLGIETVAVYSDADATSMPVRLADHAVRIGPPPPAESYLRGAAIIDAARSSGCDAVHPGFGFLSENADFAQQVLDAGLIFIGPHPASMRAMGLKTAALDRMRAAGVPTLPGYRNDEATPADYAHAADNIGYPVLVKAAAGGGGKGMRIVRDPADLMPAIEAAQREAQKAFADGRIFLEKYIDSARHIEFQVVADQDGNTVHCFERECSIQRRHQKIIEETPSPYLTPELRAEMGAAAVSAAQAVNYLNAGTVEFIVDSATGRFYFLEMNTRLQVEHPITELVTGIDLVKLQFRIAEGKPLPFRQSDITQRGHAIECRIYAEDPANGFLPSTGQILRAVEPRGPGIRVDTGVGTGDTISIHYDPMIAKLIVNAQDRPAAIRAMLSALSEYVIIGPTTNIAFLRDVLSDAAFKAGQFSTAWIESQFGAWSPAPAPIPHVALIAAALSEALRQPQSSRSTAVAPDPWDRSDGFRLGMGIGS